MSFSNISHFSTLALQSNILVKAFIAYVLLGWTFAPFIQFIEKYVYSDWHFLISLFVMVSVDTVLGVVKAFKRREVSSRGLFQLFIKILIYWCALITTHVLVHFSVQDKSISVFSWFDSVIFSAIIVREAISIFENIAAIDPGVLPISILKYLKQFDSLTGKDKLSTDPETDPL